MTRCKKIGILTLPLAYNYGGILQASALYRFLEDNGFEPLLLSREPESAWYKRLGRRVAGMVPFFDYKGHRAEARQKSMHVPFIAKTMPNRTGPLRTKSDLQTSVRRHGLDAVIVGSDQVWRPVYHKDSAPLRYWLDFVDPTRTRRIAYAASFGREDWNRPDLDPAITKLMAQFHAVSVREASGARICADHFGYGDAAVTADPTILVDPSFHTQHARSPAAVGGTLLNYVLDRGPDDIALINGLAARLDGVQRTADLGLGQQRETADQWMGNFQNADYVYTDSFHGTVFSILFNRPFVAKCNRARGSDRFVNLLGQLDLRDRLVYEPDLDRVTELLRTPIDYASVNDKVAQLREKSKQILLDALS